MDDQYFSAIRELDKPWPLARFTAMGLRALRRTAANDQAVPAEPMVGSSSLKAVAALMEVDDDA